MSKRKQQTTFEARISKLTSGINTVEELEELPACGARRPSRRCMKVRWMRSGCTRHSPAGHNSGNNRNGHSSEILKGGHGEVELDVPHDRNGELEPLIILKGQTRLLT